MKILYSLPHPAHRLDTEGAGHAVRAKAMLNALQAQGVTLVIDQAAQEGSQSAAKTYRQVVKNLLPKPFAMRIRDRARVTFSHQYGARLAEAVREHKPDVILQTHIAFSVAGKIASEQSGVPLVLDDVAPSWEEQQQYGVGSQKLAKYTHSEITGHARLCVAVSGAMRRFLIEDGIPDEKLIAVPNGIDATIFHPNINADDVRARYNISPDAVLIVFVGSFQPYHRVDLLLEAFSRVQSATPAHLLLVGAGREEPAAREHAAKLNLMARTTFSGHVDYRAVPQHIAAADVAIMPATNTYGNPMKVYEYMALGKAVLAPNQETITEIGTHGKDLLTFPPEDIPTMAATLAQVIDDAALRQRLGTQAAQTIAQAHTWEQRAQTLLSAIEARL